MRACLLAAVVAATLLAAAPSARAVISVGDPAIDFTKNELSGTSVGPAVSLTDYAGQVKILFVLGFD